MRDTKRELSRRPNRVARWAWIGVTASVALASGWFILRAAAPDELARSRGDREVAPDSAQELARIKASIKQLERKSSALQLAIATPEREATVQKEPAEEDQSPLVNQAESADARPELEKHRDVLRELDGVLETDAGNPAERRATATVFREQLNAATHGQAQVIELQCATDFCKAVLEEDLSQNPAMNITAFIDATPFLKEEAMFDYETEGSRKRTFVYAALEGRSLPFDRGTYPTP